MNIALILAGGVGTRMGGNLPKQFLKLDGKEIIIRTISAFDSHPKIDQIHVVCHPTWTHHLKHLLTVNPFSKDINLITGGDTRQQSCYMGLCELEKIYSKDDIVLIHDAARPLVCAAIITNNIETASIYHACTTALPAQDTILISNGSATAVEVPNRDLMYTVQTPQSFNLSLILRCHRALAKSEFVTDDAGILIKQGFAVQLVMGEKQNIKITSSEDMIIAKNYLHQ